MTAQQSFIFGIIPLPGNESSDPFYPDGEYQAATLIEAIEGLEELMERTEWLGRAGYVMVTNDEIGYEKLLMLSDGKWQQEVD